MPYFYPNLGRCKPSGAGNESREYTNSRSVECILSKVRTPDTIAKMQFTVTATGYTEVTILEAYASYKLLELPDIQDSPITISVEFFTSGDVTISSIAQVIYYLPDTERRYPWDPTTQTIANNLPAWHPGRRLRSSNWQHFMNLPAASMSRVTGLAQRTSDSLYLSSAPVNEIDDVGRLYPDIHKLATPKSASNLVRNPAFSLSPTPFGHIGDWSVYHEDTVQWDVVTGLFGRNAMEFVTNTTEVGALIQKIEDVSVKSGDSLTASVYYKSDHPNLTGDVVPVGQQHHVKLVCLYQDGTVGEASVDMDPKTGTAWYTAAPSITATDEIIAAWIVMHVEDLGPTLSMNATTTIGGVVVTYGTEERPFSFGYTKPHYFSNAADVDVEPSQELWLTTDSNEFWEKAIPTRVDTPTSTASSGPFTAITLAPASFTVKDALKQTHNIGYVVENDKVAMYATDTGSKLVEYNLALPIPGGFREEADLIVETLTFHNDRLWAVVRFSDDTTLEEYRVINSYRGFVDPLVASTNKGRYLCAIEHKTPAEATTYMEVIQMHPLMVTAIATPFVKMQFAQDDPQWLWLWSGTVEYYTRLYYDYGLIREDDSVWVREPETNVSLT